LIILFYEAGSYMNYKQQWFYFSFTGL